MSSCEKYHSSFPCLPSVPCLSSISSLLESLLVNQSLRMVLALARPALPPSRRRHLELRVHCLCAILGWRLGVEGYYSKISSRWEGRSSERRLRVSRRVSPPIVENWSDLQASSSGSSMSSPHSSSIRSSAPSSWQMLTNQLQARSGFELACGVRVGRGGMGSLSSRRMGSRAWRLGRLRRARRLALKQVRRERPARADHLTSESTPSSIRFIFIILLGGAPEGTWWVWLWWGRWWVFIIQKIERIEFDGRILHHQDRRRTVHQRHPGADVPFLRGNKIVCALGWTADAHLLFTEDEDIAHHLLPKTHLEARFPSFLELEAGFRLLEEAREEMLCGLIYSENELEAALIATMYLMTRFRWDCNTAFSFVRAKMEAFEFSDQAVEGLEQFERQLTEHCGSTLTHILWEYEFLAGYRPAFEEEALLINTLRNKLRPYSPEQQKQPSKAQRVRWQDQLRPASALKISSSKNLRRSSLNKSRAPDGSSSDLEVLTQPALALTQQQTVTQPQLQVVLRSAPAGRGSRKEKEVVEEDFQFLQLKEMSRTNFNDRRYMGSKLRRKGSLRPRPAKPQGSLNLHSISALVGIYSPHARPPSAKPLLSRSATAPLPFWSSLRAPGKVSLAHA